MESVENNKSYLCAISLELEQIEQDLEDIATLCFTVGSSSIINEGGRDCINSISNLLINSNERLSKSINMLENRIKVMNNE